MNEQNHTPSIASIYVWLKIFTIPYLSSGIFLILGILCLYGRSTLDIQSPDLFLIFGILSFTISFACAIASTLNLILRKKRNLQIKQSILTSNIDHIYDLSPEEFKVWIANILKLDGYKIELVKLNKDYKIDIIATKNLIKIAVLTSRNSDPIGAQAIQRVIEGRNYYGAIQGWIMSTAPSFTTEATKLAEKNNIKLFNFDDIASLLKKIQEDNRNNLNK